VAGKNESVVGQLAANPAAADMYVFTCLMLSVKLVGV